MKISCRFMMGRVQTFRGGNCIKYTISASLSSKSHDRIEYSVEKKAFEEKLNDQRKQWRSEYLEKMRLLEIQRKEEKRRIVLEKAQRDRVKREESLKRQAADRVRKDQARQRFQEHLAKNIIKYNARRVAQQRRYDRFFTDLQQESSVWITPDNIDDKITEDLFETQSTTGYVSPHSEHWRWQVLSINLNRIMSQELMRERGIDKEEKSSLSKRLDWAAQEENFKKFEVRDFLEEMIGSGKDRGRLEELVEKFTGELEHHGAFDEEDFAWYFEYMFEKNTRDHETNPMKAFPNQTPYGSPEDWNSVLAAEEKWIAEDMGYDRKAEVDALDLAGDVEDEEEEDDGIILPVKDPNKKKFGKGGKAIVEKKVKKGKKGKK